MRLMPSITLSALLYVTGSAAELKPITSLPWCRVTLNMAPTPATDAPVYKTVDGWYDEESRVMITRQDCEPGDSFPPGAFDEVRVVKVEKAPHSPALPEAGQRIANRVRAELAKDVRAAK